MIPLESWRRECSRTLNVIAENWIWVNTLNQKLTSNTRWVVEGIENLERSQWYLVLANHQSWVDILVMQRVFYRKIPLLKFFLKKELIWFPLLGQAWWALDFPFVNRYTRRDLQKNPNLKGKDVENIRKACAKFKTNSVSVMNFVEGTRFTIEKHSRQKSPYAHLLKPKAGGIAYGVRSFWSFLRGNIREVKVRVRSMPVSSELLGDYLNDELFRKNLQLWLNNLWNEKDRCIEEMLTS